MILLDGQDVANERNLTLKGQIEDALRAGVRPPGLAIVLVGDDPASISYCTGKIRACELVGITHELIRLPEDIPQDELMAHIEALNSDARYDGIVLQLPLPTHLSADTLTNLIAHDKDADGFHVVNQGYLYQHKPTIEPATPKGIMALLATYKIDPKGTHAVIVGRSSIVGFPVARLLMDAGATITVCHRDTPDIAYHTRQADILVASAGSPGLITKDMVKAGAVVIDVGVNRVEGKLVGDVDFAGVGQVASYLTPVPKGVGPMTVNALLENTFALYQGHVGLDVPAQSL